MSKNLRLLRPSLTCLRKAGNSWEDPTSLSVQNPNFKRNISVQNDSEIHKQPRLLSHETSTSSCYCQSKRWNSSVSALLVTAESLGVDKFVEFSPGHSRESSKEVLQSFQLWTDFISDSEEEQLAKEVERDLKRQQYEKDHWDEAIVGFRECEKKHWSPSSQSVVQRLREKSFEPGVRQLPYVHVLDLAEDGYIKPHIDSVRFCGDTVAILSLLSDCVLKLVHDQEKSKIVNCLVPRRSLYILKGTSRYDYTHEILANSDSFFRDVEVPKKRRISLVCRNDVTSHSRSDLRDSLSKT